MKKRDLFLTGIIALALPVSVMAQQQEVVETTPTRTKDDAKVMFEQRFEASDGKDGDAAWQEWSTTPVDSMKTITYIGHVGSESSLKIYTDDSSKYKMRFVKDSLIYMKNGVMATDDAKDIAAGSFDYDDATLVFDDGKDAERNEAFEEYGENGGKYYFQYWSDNAKTAQNYDNDNGRVPNYRRNLFVRGLNIEDNSSYRLTAYVKVLQKGSKKPTFYADVMRGYFHSEKPFTMGYVNDNNNLQYNTEFVFSKDDFDNDKWEKITFMTYYLNDSIADGYCYTGYWWAGGSEWSFRPSDDALAAQGLKLNAGDSLKHVIQPDKFFVRLSFATDSAFYSVDNISLTKSWIGGVEYVNDMIRVDFGYETNLKQLAIDAGKNSFVNAIELGPEYFEVIGYRKASGKWYTIPINSAEYHDDGYMYMWTKPSIINGKYTPNKFEVYDSVLVSFKNPDEKVLKLVYSGSKFPMALDTAWIKAGKKVHDFSNEIATPNPNIGKGVYSMKNLPPVVTKLELEKGSFHLDGQTTEIGFEFSRPVMIDPSKGSLSEDALLMVEKDGVKEFWIPESANPEAEADSVLVFKRQASDIADNPTLDGDYVFTLANIRGYGTDYAPNTSIDYSFGETVMATDIADIDFADYEESDGYTTDVASLGIAGFSGYRCAAKIKSFTGAYEKGLMWGLYGVGTGAEPDGTGAKSCNLYYTFEAKEDGAMSISFGLTGCQKGSWNDDANILIKLLNSEGKEVASSDHGATGFKPEEGGKVDEVKDYSISANLTAGTYKLAIALPKEGSYGGGHQGGKILWYLSIKSNFTLGYPYVNSLNNAIAALDKNFEKVDDAPEQYSGDVYDAQKAIYDSYKNFTDTKPSRYNIVTDSLNNANNTLKARFNVVDGMWNEYNALSDKLDAYQDSISNADGVDYNLTSAWNDADELIDEYDGFECYDQTDAVIDSIKGLFVQAGKDLDARKDLTDSYFKAVEDADAILTDQNALTSIDEYKELEDMYLAAVEITNNGILETISDDDLKSAVDNVKSAIADYNGYIAAAQATTVRIKSLARLAKKVEADFGDATSEIESRIAGIAFDDVALAEALKSAIKAAIYTKIAEDGELDDTLDLSGFIRNFNLYSPATNDQVEKYYYQWGTPNDRWKAKAGESETLFPGWKVNPNGGNVHIGSEATAWDDTKLPIFDAYLAMDWGAYVSMSQTVQDLPVGIYQIGVGFNVCIEAGDKKHTFSATTKDSVYSILAPMNIGSDTHTRPAEPNLWLDSVLVDTVGTDVTLAIKMVNVNSWAMIDNFAMFLLEKPVDGIDYAKLAAEEKAKFNTILSFVDEFEAPDVKVEYTTLDGILVPAPKPGQILIRIVTINGKSEASTVIIK